MKLSVVIPCYNEEKNIPLILKKFSEVISAEEMEVILVNNGSTDDSARVFDELLPEYQFAKTVLVEVNQGYGYGILQGLKAARGDFVGWTHADMQTDPGDVIKAYHLLEEKNWDKKIYIKGNRKGRGLFDDFFTVGMGMFESIYLGKRMSDVNAQPNFFSREFYETWHNPPYDFALDLYAFYMARKNNIGIIRFPVQFPPRIYGTSHWNTGFKAKWKFICRTVEFSKKLKQQGIS